MQSTTHLTRLFLSFLTITLVTQVTNALAAEEPMPFAPEELEQLVAPIALHPDSLISQILMASTYPLEVVQADRWVKAQSPPLKDDALAKAIENQTWDPSVRSLVTFPSVLDQMSVKLDWTMKLGDAVLGQESDVLAAIQRLRTRSQEAGHLKNTDEQAVLVQEQTIIIQQTKTEVVYVPTYDPRIVYGPWPYSAYPPTYYYPPHYVYPSAGYAFAVGVIVGSAWGYAWGGCGWRSGHIDVDINRNVNFNRSINRKEFNYSGNGRGNWKHNPSSRQGVRYRDSKTAERFGRSNRTGSGRKGSNQSGSSPSLDSYRGRSGSSPRSNQGGARDLGGNRANNSTDALRGRTTPSTGTTGRSSRSNSPFENFDSRPNTSRQSSRGRSSRSSGRSTGSSGRSRGGRSGRRG